MHLSAASAQALGRQLITAADVAPGASAWGLLLGLAVAGLIALSLRLRWQAAQLAQHREASEQLKLVRQEVQQRESRLSRELQERRDELRQLKVDLGAQRKKTHVAQQEAREMRDAAREQNKLRLEAQNSRPAFADGAVEAKTAAPPPPPAAAAPPPAAAPAPEPVPAVDVEAIMARLRGAESRAEAAAAGLEQERLERHKAQTEVQRLRKRSEDLRRIDIITKSKMEVLEDKLHNLGRQYYDAVSELAAERGEVVPPRPRELDPPEEADDEAEAAPTAEATPSGPAAAVERPETAQA